MELARGEPANAAESRNNCIQHICCLLLLIDWWKRDLKDFKCLHTKRSIAAS
jgi:hypothetical protein